MTPGSTPRPAAIWAIRCLGVAPLAPNAIMWLDIALRPGARAGHDRALPELVEDRIGQAGATDRR